MSQVAVEKVGSGVSALSEIKKVFEGVRQRAFELFERREGEPGSEVDDWLRAEQELIWAPAFDLVEKDEKFEAHMLVPGFEARDVRVSVTSDTLFVRAAVKRSNEERSLYRQIDWPRPVDTDKISAQLEQGVLTIVAVKKEVKLLPKAAAA